MKPAIYHVLFKHPDHGSGRIGCNFATADAAFREIAEIENDPAKHGWHDWLKDACLWVEDDHGNIY